jgi:hypothetical protein
MKRRPFIVLESFLISAACTAAWTLAMIRSASSVEPPKESPATVILKADANFEREAENTWLRLKDGPQDFRFHWLYHPVQGIPRATFPFDLLESQPYTFTIEGTRHGNSKTLINAQIMLITAGDGKVLYDRTICAVHRCKMDWKEVPIIYGLPAMEPGEPTFAEAAAQFPHCREVAFGGCIPMHDKNTERILVCPQCREAAARWKAAKTGK